VSYAAPSDGRQVIREVLGRVLAPRHTLGSQTTEQIALNECAPDHRTALK